MTRNKKIFLSLLAGAVLIFSGLIVIHRAEASGLYFNGAADTNWANPNNWWQDNGGTIAGSVPTTTDNVTISADVTLNTGSAAVVNTATFNGGAQNQIHLTVTGGATFTGTSSNFGIITGNAVFEGTSTNAGIITGNADVYYPSPIPIGGTVDGTITYHYSTAHYYNNAAGDGDWANPNNWWQDSSDTIAGSVPTTTDNVIVSANITKNTGATAASVNTIIFTNGAENIIPITVANNAIFENASYNKGIITGTSTYDDTSYNSGTTTNATFNGSSENKSGFVSGNVTFNDDSYNISGNPHQLEGIVGSATFNDDSYNGGSVTGNATFNGDSYNVGSIGGNATFNDDSNNGGHNSSNGSVTGNATFSNDSVNHNTVTGNADFYNLAYNAGTVNGAITYHYSSVYYFNDYAGANTEDGDWNDLSNWWTDSGFTNQASSLPTSASTVIAYSSLQQNSGSAASVSMIRFMSNPLNSNSSSENDITVTASHGAVFVNGSDNLGEINGDVVFDDSSFNADNSNSIYGSSNGNSSGIVDDNATFNESSVNYGNVYGSATFNGSSNFNSNGSVNGSVIFNDNSSNDASPDTATFNDNSVNNSDGDVRTGTFNDYSNNQGEVSGVGTYNDYSQDNDNSNPEGVATFNDYSSDRGSSNVSDIFNDDSSNNGAPFHAVFNDNSSNVGAVNGGCVFNDNSINNGSCQGANVYYYPSATLGDASGIVGTITYHTPFYFNAAVSSNWNELGDWWTNSALTTPAGSLPSSSYDMVILLASTTLTANNPTNHVFIAANGVTLGGGGHTLFAPVSGNGLLSGANGFNFTLSNITVKDTVSSNGAQSGGSGGTISLLNATIGAVTANGANATSCGAGGQPGAINVTSSSYTSSQLQAGNSIVCGGGGGGGRSPPPEHTYPPVITVLGNNPYSIIKGSSYVDPGATAVDINGSVSVSTSGTVNTAIVGTYTITYSATDAYGTSHATRTVNVTAPPPVLGCTDPTATNYNPSANTDDGSCTYATPTPPPTSNSTGSSGGGFMAGIMPPVLPVSPLSLKPLPIFTLGNGSSTNFLGLGSTNFGNLLQGLTSPGVLAFGSSTNFSLPISTFLFAALPTPITKALSKAMGLSDYLAAAGLTREQNLASIAVNPISLPMPQGTTTPPGLFVVSVSGKPLTTYLSSDDGTDLVQLVKVRAGTKLSIYLKPMSNGQVSGNFEGQTVTFTPSGSGSTLALAAPIAGARYFLTTSASPLSLAIDVSQPNMVTAPSSTSSSTPGAFSWLKNLFTHLFP